MIGLFYSKAVFVLFVFFEETFLKLCFVPYYVILMFRSTNKWMGICGALGIELKKDDSPHRQSVQVRVLPCSSKDPDVQKHPANVERRLLQTFKYEWNAMGN